MCGPMVVATLEGRKGQTRRVLNPQPGPEITEVCHGDGSEWLLYIKQKYGQESEIVCPYGQPGDRLWVRENFLDSNAIGSRARTMAEVTAILYQATCTGCGPYKWRPSIHMPRWASRITLEITDVRVERVRDITTLDAIAEGCEVDAVKCLSSVDVYQSLWDSLNAKRGFGWSTNPFVWVICFRKL